MYHDKVVEENHVTIYSDRGLVVSGPVIFDLVHGEWVMKISGIPVQHYQDLGYTIQWETNHHAIA